MPRSIYHHVDFIQIFLLFYFRIFSVFIVVVFYCNIKSPPTIRRVFFGLVFSKTVQASNEVTVSTLTLCNKKVYDAKVLPWPSLLKSVQGQTGRDDRYFFHGALQPIKRAMTALAFVAVVQFKSFTYYCCLNI